jgi:hypothetical protein
MWMQRPLPTLVRMNCTITKHREMHHLEQYHLWQCIQWSRNTWYSENTMAVSNLATMPAELSWRLFKTTLTWRRWLPANPCLEQNHPHREMQWWHNKNTLLSSLVRDWGMPITTLYDGSTFPLTYTPYLSRPFVFLWQTTLHHVSSFSSNWNLAWKQSDLPNTHSIRVDGYKCYAW